VSQANRRRETQEISPAPAVGRASKQIDETIHIIVDIDADFDVLRAAEAPSSLWWTACNRQWWSK
jgi:hypothetical protein